MLERPSKPAILLNDMWSPLQPFSNGAPSIETLAQFYDLPVVSYGYLHLLYLCSSTYHHLLHEQIDTVTPFITTDDYTTARKRLPGTSQLERKELIGQKATTPLRLGTSSPPT